MRKLMLHNKLRLSESFNSRIIFGNEDCTGMYNEEIT